MNVLVCLAVCMTTTFHVSADELNPGQIKLLHNEDPVVLMSGGFGSGKTTALALKILQLKQDNPGVPGAIISPTWQSLWSITVRRLMQTLATGLGKRHMPRVRDKTGELYLDFGDGVPVFLRSATRPDTIDGLDLGWAAVDELRHCPQKTWEVILGRVRTPCPRPQIACASTPEMHWMAEEFNTGKADRGLIRAPTIENARNLAPGFIENLRLSYSPRLQKAVIEGIFTILEGAVYENVDPDIWAKGSPWVVEENGWDRNNQFKYDPANKTYLAIDPGYVRSAWIFVQQTRPREWVVFDELILDRVTDYAACKMVNAKGYGIDEIWVDPAGDATQSTLGLDTISMLKTIKARTDNPIRYITGVFRDIPFGVDKTRVLLGDLENGLPIRLKFARRLQHLEHGKPRGLVKDLLAYRYPELKHGKPVSDQPLKDGLVDHFNDALRYFSVGMFLTEPKFRETFKFTDERYRKAAQSGSGYRVAA